MGQLPQGTLTFLFTDIEGSTRLWDKHPVPMDRAIRRQIEIVSHAVHQFNGHVVRDRGEGDSTFSVFTNPTEAVNAAAALQCSMVSEPWPKEAQLRLRASLHTGPATVYGVDYNSTDVNRCARIRSLASGGQTLISQATHALSQIGLNPGVSMREIGTHCLKDLQRPETLYQLLHPELPETFPPVRSLSSYPNNLPQHTTTFVGRAAEMEQVRRMLADTRLLTLTGAGGCGKTRLCLQCAANAVEQFEMGVWQVELAFVTEPGMVPSAIANAMGIRESPGRPLLASVAERIGDKPALIVLDNCEHLVQAAADAAHTLLASCSGLKLMATSRELLRVPGETTWRVPSLGFESGKATHVNAPPDLHHRATPDAARLFVERAADALPGFALSATNTEDIAAICRTLDGIPLALELAASRVRLFSPSQISQRLRQAFSLLTSGGRTLLPRQQTLRALVDWSWDLLTEQERTLFRRLSVFAGGFTLETAEQVCSDPPESGAAVEKWQVMDLLGELADQSLVVVEVADQGENRYRLLETLRQYGREKLEHAGEVDSLSARHLRWFNRLVTQAMPQLTGPHQRLWFNRLGQEHDNLRAALAWCATLPIEAVAGLELAYHMWRFWYTRGFFTEGRDWLALMLSAAGERAPVVTRGSAMSALGNIEVMLRNFQRARDLLNAALDLQTSAHDDPGRCTTMLHLGIMEAMQGNYQAARPWFRRTRILQARLGNLRDQAMALNNLANVDLYTDRPVRAAFLLGRSLAISRELNDVQACGMTLNSMGRLAVRTNRLDDALTHYRESLQFLSRLDHQSGKADVVEEIAKLYCAREQWDSALRLFAAMARLRETMGVPLPPNESPLTEAAAQAARNAVGPEASAEAEQAGYAMDVDQAVSLAQTENDL